MGVLYLQSRVRTFTSRDPHTPRENRYVYKISARAEAQLLDRVRGKSAEALPAEIIAILGTEGHPLFPGTAFKVRARECDLPKATTVIDYKRGRFLMRPIGRRDGSVWARIKAFFAETMDD